MNTLNYIIQKYDLDLTQRLPIEIPDIGRDTLADLFNELKFKVGVEIGVQQGAYSEVLCKAIPDLKLYGVDPWQIYKGYREYVSQQKLDRFFAETQERLAQYNWIPVKKFSIEAVKDFDDNSLDFVFIDGNHDVRHVIDDIDDWLKKVRPGGIISGHDFKRTKAPVTMLHVVDAVQAYTYAYRINPWFVLGRREKIRGEIRDVSRSWMWVKR